MELINAYTRRKLSADEVYIFRVVLCDNDVDRDGERFTKNALDKLSELFVGKTGIFDHDPTAKNQAARIFYTQVVTDSTKKTVTGEDYCFVEAKAYMLRSEKTASLINEIDGGIKKEVSIGCSMKRRTCSVCSSQKGLCAHRAGEIYDGKLCYFELDDPADAYEWSFVAVPAQKNAGVVKAYGENPREIIKSLSREGDTLMSPQQTASLSEYVGRLQKMSELGECYRRELERAVGAQLALSFPQMSPALISGIAKKLSPEELGEMKAYFDKKPSDTQLCPDFAGDNGRFKI